MKVMMNTSKRFLETISVLVWVAATGIWGDARADTNLSDQEQIQWIEGRLEIAKRISFRVQGMLDQARKDRDTLRIICLNDKLTQIHINLKSIKGKVQVLRSAVQAQDTNTANQQFAILKNYFSRIQSLKAEAENCIGEVDVVRGETEVVVTIDEDVTQEDPSQELPPIDVGVDQPPHASAYY